MTPAQEGAFIRLLSLSWIEDGLPDDPAALSVFGRVAFDGPLADAFPVSSDGRRRNPRQERVREERRAYSLRQSHAARMRWHSDGNATAMPRHSDGIASNEDIIVYPRARACARDNIFNNINDTSFSTSSSSSTSSQNNISSDNGKEVSPVVSGNTHTLSPPTPSLTNAHNASKAQTAECVRAQTADLDALVNQIAEAYPAHASAGRNAYDVIDSIRFAIKATAEDRGVEIAEAARILTEIVKTFAGSHAGRSGRYTPGIRTWFKDRRYLDKQETWQRPPERATENTDRDAWLRANEYPDT